MKYQFDTEKEAEEALRVARLKSLCWCPVIKEDCRKDCGCYNKGEIKEPLDWEKHWRVYYPYCINPLVCGVITVEQ